MLFRHVLPCTSDLPTHEALYGIDCHLPLLSGIHSAKKMFTAASGLQKHEVEVMGKRDVSPLSPENMWGNVGSCDAMQPWQPPLTVISRQS